MGLQFVRKFYTQDVMQSTIAKRMLDLNKITNTQSYSDKLPELHANNGKWTLRHETNKQAKHGELIERVFKSFLVTSQTPELGKDTLINYLQQQLPNNKIGRGDKSSRHVKIELNVTDQQHPINLYDAILKTMDHLFKEIDNNNKSAQNKGTLDQPGSVGEVATDKPPEDANVKNGSSSTTQGVDRIFELNEITDATEKYYEAKQRLYQSPYKQLLLKQYGCRCAVTGVKNECLLIACHIKPVSMCEPREKIDKHNGLLLTPTFHALLDSGLISFDDEGYVKVSDRLSERDQAALGIDTFKTKLLIQIKPEHIPYLTFHRKEIFK